MTELHDISARDRRHRERRIWRRGLLVSALLHAIVFFGWQGSVIPSSPFAAAGPRAGDNRAAAGGMQALNVPTPPSRPIVPPPTPIAVEVEVEPVQFEQEVAFDPASVLGEAPGLLEGPGIAERPACPGFVVAERQPTSIPALGKSVLGPLDDESGTGSGRLPAIGSALSSSWEGMG